MTADVRTIRELLNRRPFEPFTILMSDFRSFEVWHPSSVFFPGGWSQSLLLAKPHDQFEQLRIADMDRIDPSVSPGRVLLEVDGRPAITDRGRGPEITGTRITVYDVMDYYKHGDHPTVIAARLRVSSAQVLAAIQYIQEHEDEVAAAYARILQRHAKDNPPHIQAMLEESHKRFMARVEEYRRRKEGGSADARPVS